MTRRRRRRPHHFRPAAEPLEGRTYFIAPTFAKVVPYPAGTNPVDVVAVGTDGQADMNGDKAVDLVVANYGPTVGANGVTYPGAVTVLIGNGSGGFAAPTLTPSAADPSGIYPLSTPVQSVAVGDLNGDGYPDVVAVGTTATGTNADGSTDSVVTVLLNNGDGTLNLAGAQQFATGLRPENVALADVDHDGHLDVVTANQGDGTVSILRGTGTGAFAAAVDYAAGQGPDALAVGDVNGDGYPDIVTLSPASDTVHVLINRATVGAPGTFPLIPTAYATDVSGRAVALADTNNDGLPDIVVANIGAADVGVLTGVGDGTFNGQVTYRTGALPFSITSADLNGDNRPELITADNRDNAIGVLVHNAQGSYFSAAANEVPLQFRTGFAPESVAVADVNGDGKPDLISADPNADSVGVLLNTTRYNPAATKTTTATVTTNQPTVQVHNPLTVTAQVSPAPGVGRIIFVAGTKVIGSAALSTAGTATITTSALPVGTVAITARYGGNARFSPSVGAVVETVVTAAAATPQVAATALALTGRAGRTVPFVPGDTGTAALTVTNSGPGLASGAVAVALSIAPADDPNATVPLTVVGNSTFNLNLTGGRSTAVPVRFTLPADLAAGGYTLFAALTPARTFTAAQVNTAPIATAKAAPVVLAFGTAGVHPHYALTATLPNGAVVQLSIAGPGTGTLAEPGGGVVDLSVSGTSAASIISVTPVSGSVTLGSLTDAANVGGLSAAVVTLAGTLDLGTGARRVTLAGAVNSNIVIGPVGRAAVSLGTVTNTSMLAAGTLQSLAVASWTNGPADSLTSVGIVGSLTSGGDFGPRLSLSGARLARAAGSINIAGTVTSPTWSIGSGVGAISVGGIAAGFSGNVAGTVAGLTDAGNFAGVLAAKAFGDVTIAGDLTGADILAGASLGSDGVLGGGTDTFNVGRIASVTVNGNVTGSLVAAGFRPASDAPFTPVGGTALPGGSIGKITVGGSVDPASRFVAASLPAIG